MEATHYFDVDNWEYTTEDKSLVTDNVNYINVVRMGRFVRLPDVFVSQRYNEAKDEYELGEFPTKEEAENWSKSSK